MVGEPEPIDYEDLPIGCYNLDDLESEGQTDPWLDDPSLTDVNATKEASFKWILHSRARRSGC